MDCFKHNEMIVKPDKCQAIITNRNNKINDKQFLNIGEAKVTSEKSVTLLEIKTDNKLSFESQSLPSVGKQRVNKRKRYMGTKEKDIIINSFFYANYNYCFLVQNFCPAKSLRKIEKKKWIKNYL